MIQWGGLGTKATAPLLFALLIGGCPKRQTTPRVVYVQAPAPQLGANRSEGVGASASADALMIEEPPPQPPAPEMLPPPTPAPVAEPAATPPRKLSRPARTDSHETEGSAAPASAVPPAEPADGPHLEPSTTSRSEDASKLDSVQKNIAKRISDLEKQANSGDAERRTLQDASAFLAQSQLALRDNNMLRAQQLAEKASLLLNALESKR